MSPLTHLARSLFTMDGPYTEAPAKRACLKGNYAD